MARFYVVVRGRKIGIFDQWDGGARAQVDGFSGALYKSLSTLELAERWWAENTAPGAEPIYYLEASVELENDQLMATGPFYTYLIIDPRNGRPFYVGQTVDLDRRKRMHLREENGVRAKRPYKQIITALLSAGVQPEFRVVDEQSTLAESLHSETKWIKTLATQGIEVMNATREHREWIGMLSHKTGNRQ